MKRRTIYKPLKELKPREAFYYEDTIYIKMQSDDGMSFAQCVLIKNDGIFIDPAVSFSRWIQDSVMVIPLQNLTDNCLTIQKSIK